MNDARVPDHSAWAARGFWNKAYDCALEEITTLRAQLAEATVRADMAEAERAAQIEADAGLAEKCQRQNGILSPRGSDPYVKGLSSAGQAIAAAIRAQPHDRTALDRMLAEARAQALRDAAGRVDAIILAAEDANLDERREGLRDAHNAITRMIEGGK